jgi:hypothetical protein
MARHPQLGKRIRRILANRKQHATDSHPLTISLAALCVIGLFATLGFAEKVSNESEKTAALVNGIVMDASQLDRWQNESDLLRYEQLFKLIDKELVSQSIKEFPPIENVTVDRKNKSSRRIY